MDLQKEMVQKVECHHWVQWFRKWLVSLVFISTRFWFVSSYNASLPVFLSPMNSANTASSSFFSPPPFIPPPFVHGSATCYGEEISERHHGGTWLPSSILNWYNYGHNSEKIGAYISGTVYTHCCSDLYLGYPALLWSKEWILSRSRSQIDSARCSTRRRPSLRECLQFSNPWGRRSELEGISVAFSSVDRDFSVYDQTQKGFFLPSKVSSPGKMFHEVSQLATEIVQVVNRFMDGSFFINSSLSDASFSCSVQVLSGALRPHAGIATMSEPTQVNFYG